MNLKELEEKRDRYTTNFFWLALSTAFIFGIPAVLAAIVGNKLNEAFDKKGIEFGLLFLAFVLSWSIIAREYQKKTKVLKALDQEIKEARLKESKEKKE